MLGKESINKGLAAMTTNTSASTIQQMREHIDISLENYFNPEVSYNKLKRRMEWKPSANSPLTTYNSERDDLVVEGKGKLRLNDKHKIHKTDERIVTIGKTRVPISHEGQSDALEIERLARRIERDIRKAKRLSNQRFDTQAKVNSAIQQRKRPNQTDLDTQKDINSKIASSSVLVRLLIDPSKIPHDYQTTKKMFRKEVGKRLGFLPTTRHFETSTGFKDNHVTIQQQQVPQERIEDRPRTRRHREQIQQRSSFFAGRY